MTDEYLKAYYERYDEEGRLLSNHGRVEYLTTMRYIHDSLTPRARVLEVGAGTGRYAVALAREGYRVDAVELLEHNLAILRSKLRPGDPLTARQGSALDLDFYKDDTFDATLVLGPLYHLYTEEEKVRVLLEAKRVTKPGGTVFAAYCMNEGTVICYGFQAGRIDECLEKGMLTEDFHCLSQPQDLFALARIEDIDRLNRLAGLERIQIVASDGAANYMRSTMDAMDEDRFQTYLRYHFSTCERPDLIGASHHTLDILRVSK